MTGSTKAFAAGADIKEMKSRTYVDSYLSNQFKVYISLFGFAFLVERLIHVDVYSFSELG